MTKNILRWWALALCAFTGFNFVWALETSGVHTKTIKSYKVFPQSTYLSHALLNCYNIANADQSKVGEYGQCVVDVKKAFGNNTGGAYHGSPYEPTGGD